MHGSCVSISGDLIRMANILIVDDEALIPPMLSDYLSRFGHTVRVARSSLGALGWLDLETFDVAVLDVMMPGPMDGLDVCRMMRSDPQTGRVRILMISGSPRWPAARTRRGRMTSSQSRSILSR
jgi:CheY-like chemotaxis protein